MGTLAPQDRRRQAEVSAIHWFAASRLRRRRLRVGYLLATISTLGRVAALNAATALEIGRVQSVEEMESVDLASVDAQQEALRQIIEKLDWAKGISGF